MAIFYKGIAPGTRLHGNNLLFAGLTPRNPGSAPSHSGLMSHICDGTTFSCYISLTRSYGVARSYAFGGRLPPSQAVPGYIYEIELTIPLPSGMNLIDPISETALQNGSPLASHTYHHDGDQDFLLGVVDPRTMGHHLSTSVRDPPGSSRPTRSAHLTKELETLVRALRDAEVLVAGNLPANCFKCRYEVW